MAKHARLKSDFCTDKIWILLRWGNLRDKVFGKHDIFRLTESTPVLKVFLTTPTGRVKGIMGYCCSFGYIRTNCRYTNEGEKKEPELKNNKQWEQKADVLRGVITGKL